MIYERIPLLENKSDVFLDVYAPDKATGFIRDALLVIPGGGYSGICSGREGEPIVMAFLPYGFAAFVLHYSVNGAAKFPNPLIEASLAVKYIRDNAEKYGINPDRVFSVGFSAGGHLSAALGTMWHEEEVFTAAKIPYGYNRPTGFLAIYPVISSDPCIYHKGSFDWLSGWNKELADKYSLEKCVDSRTAPAFLVHTAVDNAVNVQNSLRFASALAENKIPFELHVFPEMEHGMALANEITALGTEHNNPHNAHWVQLAAEWTKTVK